MFLTDPSRTLTIESNCFSRNKSLYSRAPQYPRSFILPILSILFDLHQPLPQLGAGEIHQGDHEHDEGDDCAGFVVLQLPKKVVRVSPMPPPPAKPMMVAMRMLISHW